MTSPVETKDCQSTTLSGPACLAALQQALIDCTVLHKIQGADSFRANVMVTSNVASAEPLDRTTPASAARVMPKDASSWLTCQSATTGRSVRLVEIEAAPARIASRMSS